VVILVLSACLAIGTGWFIYDRWSFFPVGEIAFECEWNGSSRQICIVNADGSNRHVITSHSQPPISPTWSPDGQTLAYIALDSGSNAIHLYDYDTGDVRVAVIESENGEATVLRHISWISGGNEMLLDASIGGQPGLYVQDIDQLSVKPKLLATRNRTDLWYRSAPSDNGETYFFVDSSQNMEGRTYRIPSDGSGRQEIGPVCAYMAVSPDGQTILCINLRQGFSLISTADWAESYATNWAIFLFGFLEPAWSPDGQYIVYTQKHLPRLLSDNGELWIMRADGSHPVKLTNGPNDRNPAWRPQP
jgi:TolB protein